MNERIRNMIALKKTSLLTAARFSDSHNMPLATFLVINGTPFVARITVGKVNPHFSQTG